MRLITPPAVEPLSLEEAKAYLRVDSVDDDALISGLITAAREYCEVHQGRAYMTQTWEVAYDGVPRQPIKLPRPPLVSVESVTLIATGGEGSSLDPADYVVDVDQEPGTVRLCVELEPDIRGVRIRYVAGYADTQQIPQMVKQAMYLLIGGWYESKEAEINAPIMSAVAALLGYDRVVPA